MTSYIFKGIFFCLLAQACISSELEIALAGDVVPGKLFLAIYDAETARNWRAEPMLKTQKVLLAGGSRAFIIPEIPVGRYAARAYIDVNNNGTLDKNGMGVPLEPVAISGADAPSKQSRAFRNAIFSIGEAKNQLRLYLLSLKKNTHQPLP